MVERGEHLRFALETREPVGVVRRTSRQDFDRDIASELRVARAIDLAHAAGAEMGDDLVVRDPLTNADPPRPPPDRAAPGSCWSVMLASS